MNKNRLNNTHTIFISGVLLVLLACTMGCKKEQDPGRYYNEEYKFSIAFPDNWEVKENDFIGNPEIVSAFKGTESDDKSFRENIQVTKTMLPETTTFSSFNTLFIETLETKLDGFLKEDNGEATINDLNATWISFSYNLNEEKRNALYYFIKNDQNIYLIIGTAKPESYGESKGNFKKAITSFKIE